MPIPSQQLLNQLKRHEGFYARPYLCTASACTIGYGTNLEAHPKFIPYADIQALVRKAALRGEALRLLLVKRGMAWTVQQAESALLDELAVCQPELAARCPQFNRLIAKGQEVRAEVLLNMAFNMGVPKLLGFKNTLAMLDKAISGTGSYASVGRGMLNSRWANQVKGRARELARQMETGVYQ